MLARGHLIQSRLGEVLMLEEDRLANSDASCIDGPDVMASVVFCSVPKIETRRRVFSPRFFACLELHVVRRRTQAVPTDSDRSCVFHITLRRYTCLGPPFIFVIDLVGSRLVVGCDTTIA